MAIKGIVTIDSFTLYADQTYDASFSLCDNGHFVAGLMTNSGFNGTETSTTVNTAVRDVATGYIVNTWEGSFNPILDSIKIINPVQILGI